MNEIFFFLFLFLVVAFLINDDVVAVVDRRNLPSKSGPNQVSNK